MKARRISSEQLRAARALLRWEQRELAERSGVSHPTIARLELQPGPLKGYQRTVDLLREAFEREGLVFLMPGEDGGEGVRFGYDFIAE
ncbi:helix-turn-helix domain-containing protein [Salinarimonas ramus]|uniref:helix-turn-helix domain-containing protein n=1 Tax=Salinarimonas ramus TaxID=690164 RepID=UPI001FCE6EB5|nr:helix-turn-helix transcriptional regulator [Salinarimonas ramus]